MYVGVGGEGKLGEWAEGKRLKWIEKIDSVSSITNKLKSMIS